MNPERSRRIRLPANREHPGSGRVSKARARGARSPRMVLDIQPPTVADIQVTFAVRIRGMGQFPADLALWATRCPSIPESGTVSVARQPEVMAGPVRGL